MNADTPEQHEKDATLPEGGAEEAVSVEEDFLEQETLDGEQETDAPETPKLKPPSLKPSAADQAAKAIRGALHFEQAPDVLEKRYQLLPHEALPELDTLNAKAVKALDRKNPNRLMYALICKNDLPNRKTALKKLGDFKHPHFNMPAAHGTIPISSLNESRFVLVMEIPAGIPLSKYLAGEHHKLNDKFVVKEIILPLSEIIASFQEHEVIHGKINLDTLYYNEQGNIKIMLGECFSEPCGYGQSVYFETPDRALAMPLGRGESDPTSDYFAMGVTVLQALLGFNPIQKFTLEEYIEKCFSQGIFTTLIGNREFTGMVDDLLKGLFNDKPQDRWSQREINLWLGGKKFNLLRPTPPREAPRPYLFNDTPHFNRRHLAYSISRHWDSSRPELRERRIIRWVELSAKNPDLAERLARVVQQTGGEIGRLTTDDDDLISKSLSLLHPEGPFRLGRFAAFLSGFGPMLAEAVRDNNTMHINYIIRLLDNQYLEPWIENQKENVGFGSQDLVWHIENRRRAYTYKSLGFGLERVMYDLNATLPCLSPMVVKHHVSTVPELLFSLDGLTAERARLTDPFDKHIAAFITSKLDILAEIKTSVEQFPSLNKSQTLKMLALFAFAQKKTNMPALPGLCRWYSERLKPVIEIFHSRSLRREIREEMDRLVAKGSLAGLLRIFANPEVISQDVDGFQRARIRYQRNAVRIAELNQRGTIDERAQELGLKIAMISAYGTFIVTLLRVIQDYVRF